MVGRPHKGQRLNAQKLDYNIAFTGLYLAAVDAVADGRIKGQRHAEGLDFTIDGQAYSIPRNYRDEWRPVLLAETPDGYADPLKWLPPQGRVMELRRLIARIHEMG